MLARIRYKEITREHIRMISQQINAIMDDQDYKTNIKLQTALGKINRRVAILESTRNEDDIVSFNLLLAEMLILFLGVSSQFETIAKSDEFTESQREHAARAISEDNSDIFADMLRHYYEVHQWQMLKSAPINKDEVVEIIQSIKTRYGNTWKSIIWMPDNPDKPKSGSGGSLLDLPPIKWK